MPLPGTRIIHPLFQVHHAATIAQTQTAECAITRPSSHATAFDEATGRSVYVEADGIYAGRCRVQRRAGRSNGSADVGDRQVHEVPYLVTLPASSLLVLVNDVVTVTGAAHDLNLVGVQLTVVDVWRGSTRWEQDLYCDLLPATNR